MMIASFGMKISKSIDVNRFYISKYFIDSTNKPYYTKPHGARWYNFERLTQTDDYRRAAVASTHIVQSVHPIARWKAK